MNSTASTRTPSTRKILLGVTGGIAAYKSPDLVRRLQEQGAQVQVVMTRGAREFVTEQTFGGVRVAGAQRSWDRAASGYGAYRTGALGR
jgi:phosphopantothenoylcysteine decarboxylase/phosphopantothenate--cysteine ligase